MNWWVWILVNAATTVAMVTWAIRWQYGVMVAAWQRQLDHEWAVKQREEAGVLKTLHAQRATLDEALVLLHEWPMKGSERDVDEDVVAFCVAHPLPEKTEDGDEHEHAG